jgi:hypothetical protein
VLAAPGAWAALRFGALRGFIASLGAGLLYELIAVVLLMALSSKDQSGFGFGFGLLIAQGVLGLFWIPLQALSLALAAALRRRRRSDFR